MPKIEIELKRKGADYVAVAIYDTESNIVTIKEKKSKMPPTITGGSQRAKDERNEIRRKKIVDAAGVFQEDYNINPVQQGDENTPLARASDIIAGFNNGLRDWTIIGGDYPDYIGKTMQDWTNNYKRKGKHSSGGTDDSVHTDNDMYLRQNIIFYGVPGCGKSYKIKKILEGVDTKYYKRILFHPEYSYSDFVGQLRPVTEDRNITYPFVPGPFTEILRDAYADQEHTYFLIIEEINRGNAPAIFGDLFQLLDRKDGVSEYSIYNKDILDYFKESKKERESEKDESGAMAQVVETITRDGIRLPSNLTIFATMNTCDQNVFTLDTAFKRRWRMSRIPNDFNKAPVAWEIKFPNGTISWKDFAEAVNDAILNNCNDGTEAEDKQLGAFFVQADDCTDAERFAQKVLMYLWDDVAKYDKAQLFDTNAYKTLDVVIDAFAKGKNVFSANCTELKRLYDALPAVLQEASEENSSENAPAEESEGSVEA